MGKYEWLGYVAIAGLAWGTYVPIIFYGGFELGGKPKSRLVAILCVGVAYFLVGVLLPLALFATGVFPWPKAEEMRTVGLVFSGLARTPSWEVSVLMAVPFLAWSTARLMRTAREWTDPVQRARVVVSVAA